MYNSNDILNQGYRRWKELKLNNETKKGYLLHTFSNSKIALCKILNEYNSEQEAEQDLFKLLSGKQQEEDVLLKYSKKDI